MTIFIQTRLLSRLQLNVTTSVELILVSQHKPTHAQTHMSSDELVIPWINAFKKAKLYIYLFPFTICRTLTVIWLYLQHLSGFSGPYIAFCLSSFKHNAGTVHWKTHPVVQYLVWFYLRTGRTLVNPNLWVRPHRLHWSVALLWDQACWDLCVSLNRCLSSRPGTEGTNFCCHNFWGTKRLKQAINPCNASKCHKSGIAHLFGRCWNKVIQKKGIGKMWESIFPSFGSFRWRIAL